MAHPIKPGEPMTQNVIAGMSQTERILDRFFQFLLNTDTSEVISKKKADNITAKLIDHTNNPGVLMDLAIGAQLKLNIYSMMPASDKILWQSLLHNCLRKLGPRATETERRLLARYNNPMLRKAKIATLKRDSILAQQLATHKIFSTFLLQANAMNIRAGQRNERGTEVAAPIIGLAKNTDVLTDLASTFKYKRELYDNFEGSNLFFEMFLCCGKSISNQPKAEAIDSLNFLGAISTGQAASSEFLDGYKAHTLGLTMDEFVRRKNKPPNRP